MRAIESFRNESINKYGFDSTRPRSIEVVYPNHVGTPGCNQREIRHSTFPIGRSLNPKLWFPLASCSLVSVSYRSIWQRGVYIAYGVKHILQGPQRHLSLNRHISCITILESLRVIAIYVQFIGGTRQIGPRRIT